MQRVFIQGVGVDISHPDVKGKTRKDLEHLGFFNHFTPEEQDEAYEELDAKMSEATNETGETSPEGSAKIMGINTPGSQGTGTGATVIPAKPAPTVTAKTGSPTIKAPTPVK